MQKVLVDSGPLIALFDKHDRYHERFKLFLTDFKGKLITSWPVLTEVSHLLDFSKEAQIDFLRWIYAGGVEIVNVSTTGLLRIIELIDKYSDVPMDLADASLMYLAEDQDIQAVATIDTDYYIYRTKEKKSLKNVLEPFLDGNGRRR